jgi:DNA repair exonuclease SbcCD ATPase subunit
MTDNFSEMKQRFSDLEDRFENVSSKSENLQNRREFLQEKKDSIEDKIESLQEEILLLKKVEELFKFLLDEYVHKYAESFSRIVTEGLQTIFHDQDLKFNVNVTQKRKKVNVEFETVQGSHKGQALESFGGGVAAVESLLMRILVVLKTGLSRYLILDESLASLSEEYIDTMSAFLRKLCSHFDMNILLITHNRSFSEHADNSYHSS